MAGRRVGADDHDDVGLPHRIEGLGASRLAEGLLQPITGRRMADARAGVDIVVAKGSADQLLHQIAFFVGAAAGDDAADRVLAVFALDALDLAGSVIDRHLPAHLLPRIVDALADHRCGDAVLVGGVAESEAALDARVPVVGVAILVGHQAHHLVALGLGLERAPHTAVGAGGDGAFLGLTVFDHRLLHQGGGRAGLHAGAAAHALGIHERLIHARRHARLETAARDGQREGALGLFAGTHAAVANDALARVIGEVGVGEILDRAGADVEVVLALVAVAHLAQADHAGHVLQLAVAIGRAGQAVQGVVGDVELHHALADLGELGRLRGHLHAGLDQGGARRRVAAAALDLDEAQAAGAERLEAVGGAQLGDGVAGILRGTHHRGAGGYRDLDAIDAQGDQFFGFAGGGAVIDIAGQ